MKFAFNPFNAVFGLLQSRKFLFSMIIYWPTFYLCDHGHITDTAYMAVVSTLTGVFLAAHTYTDVKTMTNQQPPPNMMNNNAPSYDPTKQ